MYGTSAVSLIRVTWKNFWKRIFRNSCSTYFVFSFRRELFHECGLGLALTAHYSSPLEGSVRQLTDEGCDYSILRRAERILESHPRILRDFASVSHRWQCHPRGGSFTHPVFSSLWCRESTPLIRGEYFISPPSKKGDASKRQPARLMSGGGWLFFE